MKIRSGFVSNSSSSSFVLIGWEFNRNMKTRIEWLEETIPHDQLDELSKAAYDKPWDELEKNDKLEIYYEDIHNQGIISILDDEENGAPKNKTRIGKLIIGDSVVYSLKRILDDLNFSSELFNPDEIRIFIGTMCT